MRKLFHHATGRETNDSSSEVPFTNDQAPSDEDLNHYNSETLPDQNKSIIWSIIKQLRIGESVKHLQLPTFVLQPRSLLEKLTDSFVHPELIQDIAVTEDPKQRFLQVLRFFAAGWHYRQPGVRNALNPVIGEIFRCSWRHQDTEIFYFAEQLSHHPPQSAFIYYNIEKGYAINANIAPTYVTFRGNSAETQIQGLMRLHVFGKNFQEEIYEMTFPGMLVRGILFGTLTYEVVGKATIRCLSSPYEAEFIFKPKAMFRGKLNAIGGRVRSGNEVLWTLDGFWDSVMYITDCTTKEVAVLFDCSEHKICDKFVSSREEQMPNESRRLWEDVVRGMLTHDEEEALNAKRRLEEVQRLEEHERLQKGIEWTPKYFVKNSEGIYYHYQWEKLTSQIKQMRFGPVSM